MPSFSQPIDKRIEKNFQVNKDMRLQKISVLVAVMALVLALGGCRGKKEKQAEGPQKTEFEQSIQSKDTVAVKQLVDRFFGFAKAK